jgi:uncharacterized membrane protein
VDQIHAFRRELDLLLREGALELAAEQRARLDSHLNRTLAEFANRFDVDITDTQKRFSLGMRILSTLGGLALCMALVMFFYRIWGGLVTPVQVTLLIGAPVLVLLALEAVSRRDRTRYYTGLVGSIAVAAMILDLSVLGQMFNIAPSPEALLVWSAFALIVAYGYNLRLPLAAGLTCAAVWLAARAVWLSGAHWEVFGDRPEVFLAAGTLIALLPLVVTHGTRADFPVVYRVVGMVLALGALEILMHPSVSYIPAPVAVLRALYQVMAFAVAGVTVWLGVRQGFRDLTNVGSAFFALFLFDRLFSWWWDWMPKYLFFLIIGATAIALLVLFRKVRAQSLSGRTV